MVNVIVPVGVEPPARWAVSWIGEPAGALGEGVVVSSGWTIGGGADITTTLSASVPQSDATRMLLSSPK
jgi:hypothetical protein